MILMKTIDYYFAPSSPWTYLGHQRLIEIAARHQAAVRPMPVDLAGRVFPGSGGLPLPHLRRVVDIGLYGAFALVLIFFYTPIFTLIAFSFQQGRYLTLPFECLSLEWYRALLANAGARTALVNSTLAGGSEPRFTMLETIRAYALAELEPPERLAELRRRQLAWCIVLAEGGQPRWWERGTPWLDRVEPELANVDAALDFARETDDVVGELRLAASMRHAWRVRGQSVARHGRRFRSAQTSPCLLASTAASARLETLSFL